METLPAQRMNAEMESLARLIFPARNQLKNYDADFKVYMAICNGLGINPISKQIYPVPYEGQMTLQMSITGLRSLAYNTGLLRAVVNHRLRVRDKSGNTLTVAHELYDPEDHIEIISGTVDIIRTDYVTPQSATAIFRSFCKFKQSYDQGKPTGKFEPQKFWKTMPDVMILKVAEATGLRREFEAAWQNKSGAQSIYIPEEMPEPETVNASFHVVAEEVPKVADLKEKTEAKKAAPKPKKEAPPKEEVPNKIVNFWNKFVTFLEKNNMDADGIEYAESLARKAFDVDAIADIPLNMSESFEDYVRSELKQELQAESYLPLKREE